MNKAKIGTTDTRTDHKGHPPAAPEVEHERLERYIRSVKHLPPAPKMIVELLPLFRQTDRDLDRIVTLLTHDPAFTGEILKYCNSAHFGGGAHCLDMFEAVTRLGLFEVYRIVIAVSGAHTMSAANAADGLNVQKMWHHSVVSAVAASVIAEKLGGCIACAFTAGLMHDIGKLVLASTEGRKYSRMLADAERTRQPLVELEQAAFGFDHAALGAHMLTQWSLPHEMIGGVRHHHNLAAADGYRIPAAVVNLADAIAHASDDGFTDPRTTLAKGTESGTLLHLSPEKLAAFFDATQKGLDQVKDLLTI
jgi:putative nucleotidyltransferase with HDIG domain